MIQSFFFLRSGDTRDLHVVTHSYPTRRSSELSSNCKLAGQKTHACRSACCAIMPGNRTALPFQTASLPNSCATKWHGVAPSYRPISITPSRLEENTSELQ